MEIPVDEKVPEDTPRPEWEKQLLKRAPRHLRGQFAKYLAAERKRTPDEAERVKKAAKELASMNAAMTAEGSTLALFTADILMLAVIVHSFFSAGIFPGIAAAMFGLAWSRGQYYPLPKGRGEVLAGALVAMALFVVTVGEIRGT